MQIPSFSTETGTIIPVVRSKTYRDLIDRMIRDYEFTLTHISEATSYSMAMVVRHSLGSYADNGVVLCIVSDSLAGFAAIATMRHLLNGGARGKIIIPDMTESLSENLHRELNMATKVGIEIIPPTKGLKYINESLKEGDSESIHCVVAGIFGGNSLVNDELNDYIDTLNNLAIPVHALVFPTEFPESDTTRLYCASTLSLGIPVEETITKKEFIGRHYLCDISMPQSLYQEVGLGNCNIFSEQPIVKLLDNI